MDKKAYDRHSFFKNELVTVRAEQASIKNSHIKVKEKFQKLTSEVSDMKHNLNQLQQRDFLLKVIVRGLEAFRFGVATRHSHEIAHPDAEITNAFSMPTTQPLCTCLPRSPEMSMV